MYKMIKSKLTKSVVLSYISDSLDQSSFNVGTSHIGSCAMNIFTTLNFPIWNEILNGNDNRLGLCNM